MAGTPAEFDLIARIRERAGRRGDVVIGIGDDAAVLEVPAGRQLVVAMDTLNDGVHFPAGTEAAAIGWKALAVNLSDLAAMGAEPAWCTLSLAMPAADPTWLDGFLDGFASLASLHGIALVGGDTTRGPLSVCVTVHGFVVRGHAITRSGARAGDGVWVTGTLGDAAAALPAVLAGADVCPALRARLDRPMPRVAMGRALAGIATSCIDVSDGLLADVAHIGHASGVRIEIDIDALPASAALPTGDAAARRAWQACGGDDYELCFTAPADASAALEEAAAGAVVAITPVGRVLTGGGVRAIDAAGDAWCPPRPGHVHFAG